MRKLTGEDRRQLIAALLEAFPSPQELEMLLDLRLDRSLAAIAPTSQPYEYVTFKVIERSEAEGWTGELILAASSARPGNQTLAKVAQPLGLVPSVGARLEQMISPRNGVHDVERWLGDAWRSARRVCRLEMRTRTAVYGGTGFLVGPDEILTNFHVVQELMLSGDSPEESTVRFDVRSAPDGGTVLAGRPCRLAEEWLLAWSPQDDAKEQSIVAAGDDARLDYALLRLAEPVGEEEIGLGAPAAARRGWVALSPRARTPVAGDQTVILQHPGGGALKLAADSVVEYIEKQAAVRYLTNTDEGSSGSPCFGFGWELVALHQGGSADGASNQGHATCAIAQHILGRLGVGVLPDPEGA
ncbi:MAG TPA: effector-associated domain EAD1-containing protein [Solirubrobacteraceae bacterium]|jgi:hypothetical protein|nr:effector-associated domain EAD1-containing protein [Solirubrobacteraceae bacterium]